MSGKLSAVTSALVSALVSAARRAGMLEISYIVGGAVRDFLLNVDQIKDVDVVVDSMPNNDLDAMQLARSVCDVLSISSAFIKSDAYGVVHIGPFVDGTQFDGTDLLGQKLEIVTARREKYNKNRRVDSHKPLSVERGTISDDIYRRDFTMNALCWNLADISSAGGNMEEVKVIDLTGRGICDVNDGVIDTPLKPEVTFDEDPTRMLRAIKFAAKYRMQFTPRVLAAMRTMAEELRRLPYEAVDIVFEKILALDSAAQDWALIMLQSTGQLRIVREMIPETRLRRMLQNIVDPVCELRLHGAGFPVPISTLSDKHVNYLRHFVDKIPSVSSDTNIEGALALKVTQLQKVIDIRQTFLKPPFDCERFIAETGAVGKTIGLAVKIAREELLYDPTVSKDDLYSRVVKQVRLEGS